jgi:homoserine acetyltransferase
MASPVNELRRLSSMWRIVTVRSNNVPSWPATRLIFPDNVGHGQSSKPGDGLRAAFPKYGYRDMVDLQHRLIAEKLGIEHLHALLGMSMGGMNAWQWAEA